MSVTVKSHLRDIIPYLSSDIYFAYGSCYQLGTLQNVEHLVDASYRPVLRPMSDLFREITSHGKTFVPIVEIGKLLGFDRLVRLDDTGRSYIVVDGPDGEVSRDYIFDWDAKDGVFAIFLHITPNNNLVVDRHMSVPVFDFLHEHLFDYRGLISKGVAVDINTIDMYSINFTVDYDGEC